MYTGTERRAQSVRQTRQGLTLNFKQWLAARGFGGHVAAHVMPWHGEPNHIHRSSYKSNDPATVAKHLELMRLVGIDTVLLTWQGIAITYGHQSAIEIAKQCAANGMRFGFVLDPWMCKGAGTVVTKDPVTGANVSSWDAAKAAQAVINSLTDPSVQAILNSPAYLPEKYILDFGTNADLNAVAAVVPGFSFLKRHIGYSWMDAVKTMTDATGVKTKVLMQPAETIAILAKDNARPEMRIPGLMPYFNDAGCPLPTGVGPAMFTGARDYSLSVWGASTGKARVIESMSGKTFFDQLAVTPMTVPYIAIITWDDFEEGTAISHWVSILAGVPLP